MSCWDSPEKNEKGRFYASLDKGGCLTCYGSLNNDQLLFYCTQPSYCLTFHNVLTDCDDHYVIKVPSVLPGYHVVALYMVMHQFYILEYCWKSIIRETRYKCTVDPSRHLSFRK